MADLTPKQRGERAVNRARHQLDAWLDSYMGMGDDDGPADDDGWFHVQNLLTEIDRLNNLVTVLEVSRDSYKQTFKEQQS